MGYNAVTNYDMRQGENMLTQKTVVARIDALLEEKSMKLGTLATLSGGKVPNDRIIDGKNITPLLMGKEDAKSPYEAFYYYNRDKLEAVRSGDWKLRTDGGLYNLKEDIGEQKDVAKEYQTVVERLNKYLDEMRNDLGKEENCRPPGIVENPQYLK